MIRSGWERGGIQWGPAAEATQVYVVLSDVVRKTVEHTDGGWTRVLDANGLPTRKEPLEADFGSTEALLTELSRNT